MAAASPRALLDRVELKDYRSIASCGVDLAPLTFLVGPNGSGKSNFLDALRFVSDSLSNDFDAALRDRGGLAEVRRRSSGRPRNPSILLRLQIGRDVAIYFVELAAKAGGKLGITERCEITRPSGAKFAFTRWDTSDVAVDAPGAKHAPKPVAGRLYLATVAGFPGFDAVFAALSRMAFYNLNPASIRELQSPDTGERLRRDGSNLAAVFGALSNHHPRVAGRIVEFLGGVVPGISGVAFKTLGPKETLEFTESGEGGRRKFFAANMSDGTLRTLGVLTALFQSPNGGDGVSLVGIEEPELALHPAAAGILVDGLREASLRRQVVVTSHSPDLLDRDDIPAESLLAVSADRGETVIGPVGKRQKCVLRKKLQTPGELLRLNQLQPDAEKR